MRRKLLCGSALALLLLIAGQAQAQGLQPPGQPYQRPATPNVGRTPAVSPYLNMDRGGLAAVNYYGLVRPQIENAQNFQQLQNQITLGQNPVVGETQPGVTTNVATGLRPQFLSLSHYYPFAGKTQEGRGPTAAFKGR